jgi:hypothetical protein
VIAPTDVWSRLGIERTRDELLIRRAYAQQLKKTNPEDDAEAFKELRAAYDQALASVRQLAADAAKRTIPVSMPPDGAANTSGLAKVIKSPDPTDRPSDSVRTQRVAKLQSDLQALDALTGADAPQEALLREAFARCLASPALEDVQTQLAFEYTIARWLIAKRPATDSLFIDAAGRFNWERREGSVGLSADIAMAISQLRDIQYWDAVEAPESPLARACRSLVSQPKPLWLRTQMVIFNLDRAAKVLLLEIFRQHGSLVRKLNPAALEWWKIYLSRPRLSMGWLRLLSPLLPLAMVFGLLAGSRHNRMLLDGFVALLMTVTAIAAILVYKLFAIDKPTHWYQQRYRAGSPAWLRVGWFPVGLTALATSAWLPQNPWSVAGMTVVGSACIAWAAIVAPIPLTGQPLHRLVGYGALMNLAVIACWLLLAVGSIDGPGLAMWPIFIAVLIAERIGASALYGEYKFGLSKRVQKFATYAITIAALAAVWLSFTLPFAAPWIGLNTAVLLAVVLCARTPSNLMTDQQGKIRYFILYLPALFVLQSLLNHEGRSDLLKWTSATHLIQVIAAWLMVGVIMAMAMVNMNQRKIEG